MESRTLGLATIAALVLVLGWAPGQAHSAQTTTSGATFVVDRSGLGDATTISEAVAAAEDGDQILVRPGIYREPLEIHADILLQGDASDAVDGSVMIEIAGPGPGFRITQSNAHISDLTLRGPGSAIVVQGGAPTIERVRFDGVEAFRGINLPTVAVHLSDTRATIRDNVLTRSGEFVLTERAEPLIEGNVMIDGHGITIESAADPTVVRNNHIEGAFLHGIEVRSEGEALIEDNVIERAGSNGISIGLSRSPGVDPTVRNNTVSDSSYGITISNLTDPLVTGNLLSGNDLGISTAVSNATVSDNIVRSGGVGITTVRHDPVLEGNVVEDNVIGLLVEISTTPHLADNRICGVGIDVLLTLGATAPALAGNEICTAPVGTG